MIDRDLDGRLRRRGKEVVRDLEDNAPLAEDVRRLRDELGELRTLAGALRERVEHLEADDAPVHGKPKKPKKPKKKKK